MKRYPVVLASLGFALLGAQAAASQAAPSQISAQPSGAVEIVELRGLLDVPLADHLTDRLDAAQASDAALMVVQVDLPGVLYVDVPALAEIMEGSPVPVVIWIAPRGATVSEGAAPLLDAGDALFASSPSESSSAAAEQASSLRALLEAVDARPLDGTTLDVWDEAGGAPRTTLRFHQLDLWPRLLHSVTSPEIALLLLLIGIYGLVFEIYNPGIGLAAIVGAGSLALSMYAFGALPTSWIALLGIVIAVLLLVADVHLAGFGALSLAGLAGMVAGTLFLFPRAEPGVSLSLGMIAAAVVATVVFFVSVMTAALRVRLRRPISDEDALVGAIGEAKTDIAPEGTVISKGMLWRARTMETGIAAGERVKIMAAEGLVLLVEPLHEESGS